MTVLAVITLTAQSVWTKVRPAAQVRASAPIGAFLGSDAAGAARIAEFERWLGTTVNVGHTYLPGESWRGVEGPDWIIRPWSEWYRAAPGRLFVLNVPMLTPNEAGRPDRAVRTLLRAGARGGFDKHFRTLAERLVGAGLAETVLVPGWEMNGTTYTGRCGPSPDDWKTYWRRIVSAMRAVPGARFRFDFTATRGRDAHPWPDCYPGDDVVDIIGSDSYDQPRDMGFQEMIDEPYGLQAHAQFAKERGKPISFPEWGLFRNGDNPDYVRNMHAWMSQQNVAYQTISDYCPHGVWRCTRNPRSSEVYRALFGGAGEASPSPSPTPDASAISPEPSPSPSTETQAEPAAPADTASDRPVPAEPAAAPPSNASPTNEPGSPPPAQETPPTRPEDPATMPTTQPARPPDPTPDDPTPTPRNETPPT